MDTKIMKEMFKIRAFEINLLNMFQEGKLAGTTHTYIGEEAIAVSALQAMTQEDAIFTNHRCHGHFLAYGGHQTELLCEIMGKQNGVCGGRGGSQHLCYENFFSNGIQGGMFPIAAGYALGNKYDQTGHITTCFVGDGTFGEGIVYETLNMISLYNIPLLLIVEDNGYAQSTKKENSMSGNIQDRIQAFHIETKYICSNDISELISFFDEAVCQIKKNQKPLVCIVETYRLAAHSKGDDYRDKSEIEEWKKRDPIQLVKKYYTDDIVKQVELEVKNELTEAMEFAQKSEIDYSDLKRGISVLENKTCIEDVSISKKIERFSECINHSLHNIFTLNDKAIIIGEDIADPYGGAFKITKGLSDNYSTRVISTPISEAGFTGLANGLALYGYKPIIEIMFGDFSTLILDQIINHAAKFSWMYNNQRKIAILIRLTSGGKRGYGPTHSQCMEKIFMGFPNISVLAPTIYHPAGKLLQVAYENMTSPVIFIEYKSFYSKYMHSTDKDDIFNIYTDNKEFPTLNFTIEDEFVDVTIICYGEIIEEAKSAASSLMMREEINVQIICPSYIYPIQTESIYQLISTESKMILILDNSFDSLSWSKEIAYELLQKDKRNSIDRIVSTLGSEFVYIPASIELEKGVLLSSEKIISQILKEMHYA